METKPLIPIGSSISVDKSTIQNVLPKKLLDDLPQTIEGEIIDYKMTDGKDIGYVFVTEKGKIKIWIFNNELNEESKKQYDVQQTYEFKNITTNDLFLGQYKIHYELSGSKKIKSLTSPLNLINWLLFTLKDIV